MKAAVNVAITPPIVAMPARIAAPKPVNAAALTPTAADKVPIEDTKKPTPTTAPPKSVTMPPKEATKGPIAAPKATKAKTALRALLSSSEIEATKLVILLAIPVKSGKISSANWSLKPLIALFSSSQAPNKSFNIKSAVSFALPSQRSKIPIKSSNSLSVAVITPAHAFIPRAPVMMPKLTIFVCVSRPRNASRISRA